MSAADRIPITIFVTGIAALFLMMLVLITGCHSRRELSPADAAPPEREMRSITAPTPTPVPPSPEPALRQQIVTTARSLEGTPYRYGGNTVRGFDCSGYVQFVYGQLGIDLPRRSEDQYRMGRQIVLEEIAPGDLVFFAISRRTISHVGIFIGNGEFIHAPSSGGQVMISDLQDEYWRSRLMGVCRYIQES